MGSDSMNQRVIVLESDDWGSIRTPKGINIDKFERLGLNFSKNPYFQFDTLEDTRDIEHLIKLFETVENETGKKPQITLNYVMTNPDFQKIRESGFKEYFFEKFPETYKRACGEGKSLELINKGMHLGYFLPQFHGREHVHVPFWLDQLQNGNEVYRVAFDSGFWGIGPDVYPEVERNIQASFDLRGEQDMPFVIQSIGEGLDLFEETFGFRSKSFIPNNYIWPDSLNKTLLENGIEYMQGMKLQLFPKCIDQKKRGSKKRKSGKIDQGLIQLVRNSSMEFSFYQNREKVLNDCLRDIQTAFFWKQPSVISIHRLNFVGGLNEQNRIQNLSLLKKFFLEVVRRWPEVEFWNSVELGEYFKSQTKT